MKKNLIISFCIALIYFVISLGYFFGGYFSGTPGSILESLESVVIFPAVIIFGAGFTGGNVYTTGILILLIIWIISFIITLITKTLIACLRTLISYLKKNDK